MGYSTSGIASRTANSSYGYSNGLSGKVSYSLAMPKSYGADINLDGYLKRNKSGIDGYVNNLIKYSSENLKSGYLYPRQKKEELYKVQEMMKNYDLKLLRNFSAGTGGAGLGMTIYDLPSMRRPVINLEARLN